VFLNCHTVRLPISALGVTIKFYVAVSLLPLRLKMPISALLVAIRFDEGGGVLPIPFSCIM
jgi:hypothetical protein